jgi:predicted metal-binding protein
MKIGILRCQDQSSICAGYHCFAGLSEKTGEFSRYDSIEIAGFETCGGCCRGKATRIVNRALRLKYLGGAEVIHLSNCLVNCPYKNVYKKAIMEKVGLPVVEGTHPVKPPTPEEGALMQERIAAYTRDAEAEPSPIPIK